MLSIILYNILVRVLLIKSIIQDQQPREERMSSESDVVSVTWSPASSVRTVLLPPWVRNIEVMARTDSHDLVTVELTRRWDNERWLALPLEEEPSGLAVACLLGGGRKHCDESTVHARVLVPPRRLCSIGAVAIDFSQG